MARSHTEADDEQNDDDPAAVFECFEDEDGRYRWRLIDTHYDRVIAKSARSQPTRESAHRSAVNARQLASGAEWIDVETDGGEQNDETKGAIDHSFEENQIDTRETLLENSPHADRRQFTPGSIAIDLVTRQPLYVAGVVADNLAEYYERENFDLLNYKTHPYLPVRVSDRVVKCVFVARSVEGIHKPGDSYDFPEGRLARVPIEDSLNDGGDR